MFNEFTKWLFDKDSKLLKSIFISLLASFITLGVLYYFKLRYIEDFIPKYGLYALLIILTYSIILPSMNYVRAYREFACMSGMMIGMTMGMIAGFLPGLYIGANNGMFWGSIFGMASGILFGAWNGKCCGIMGVMEGIMAGFMGGLMGAMTAVMMLNDNLKAASIIIFIISGSIMIGLNYMIYKETRQMEKKAETDDAINIFLSIMLTGLSIWLMVFGPKSVLFQ